MSTHRSEEVARQLGRRARQLTLSMEEKLAGLHTLQQLTNANPLPPETPRRQTSTYSWRFWMVATMVAILMVGAGSTLAAQRSLPGDVLYSVKIHLAEPLTAWLAMDPNQKARAAIRQAATRVREAEILSASGKLSAEWQHFLETDFRTQTKKIASYVQEFKNVGEDTIAANLDAEFQTLNATYQKLERIKPPTPKVLEKSNKPSSLKPKVVPTQAAATITTIKPNATVTPNAAPTPTYYRAVTIPETTTSLNAAVTPYVITPELLDNVRASLTSVLPAHPTATAIISTDNSLTPTQPQAPVITPTNTGKIISTSRTSDKKAETSRK